MKNYDYSRELIMANEFVISHNADQQFLDMLEDLKSSKYCHSDRWSVIYDYMKEHYPSATGSLITGLAYWIEQ